MKPWEKYGYPAEVLKYGRADEVLVSARIRAAQLQHEASYLIDATNLMLQAAGGFEPLFYFGDLDTGVAVCEPSGMEPEYFTADDEGAP